jgi:glycosyltransferase involved in cell wall biosynthesis
VLERALALAGDGVVLHPPVTKRELAAALAGTRLFLYGGDPGETFCLAAAESQAAGVPGVVARSTCLAERVVDGVSGFVTADDDAAGFARRAVELFTDDALWRRQHIACLDGQRGLSWRDAAGLWETLLP